MHAVTAVRPLLLLTAMSAVLACAPEAPQVMVTIADARVERARLVDIGQPGDSEGDLVVFDQPLLDEHGTPVGNNSGACIRTRVAHSYQCQWTLSFDDGSIQVAGRELEKGSSDITIVGGTGMYSGISGDMVSINNEDGTFTQTLRYRLP